MAGNLQAYVVIVEDHIVQVREYIVLAEDGPDAEELVQKGEFFFESEPTTVETIGSEVVRCENLNTYEKEER